MNLWHCLTAVFVYTWILLLSVEGQRIHTATVGIIAQVEENPWQYRPTFWSSEDSDVVLYPVVQGVRWWDALQVTRAVCKLLKRGIHVIVSTAPPRLHGLLNSYAHSFKTYFVSNLQPSRGLPNNNSRISMMGNSAAAVAELIKYYRWKSFIFFYDNDAGAGLLEDILEATNYSVSAESVWKVSTGEDAQRLLEIVKHTDDNTIHGVLLATKESVLEEMLDKFPEGSAVKRKWHFILAEPVGYYDERGYAGYMGSFMVTKLSFLNIKRSAVIEFRNRWPIRTDVPFYFERPRFEPIPESIPDSAVIMKDTSTVLHKAFSSVFAKSSQNWTAMSQSCLDFPVTALDVDILNPMIKMPIKEGVTGNIAFSDKGERTNYAFDILKLTPVEYKKLGNWSDGVGLKIIDASSRGIIDKSNPGTTDKYVNRPKIRVTTILAVPYMMKNDAAKDGNDQYTGFLKDLMDEIAVALEWEYELHIVKDNQYGRYNGNRWTGLIGEVMDGVADIALASITITPQRRKAIDFTKPFMSVGLNVVMKKQEDIYPSLGAFSFITVWSYDVWLLLTLAYCVVSISAYAVSHFTGEPDRIRSLDTKLSDRLSLCSSFWFTLGSLTFRSTGIYPRSATHRVLSVIWWAFSLFVVASYISSLSAALIKARTSNQPTAYSGSSHDVLKHFLENGYPAVGVVKGGSTYNYFTNAEVGLHSEYGKYLLQNPDVLAQSNDAGAERIRTSGGSFAMVMESSFSEYVRNTEPCDIVVTSGFLDHRQYGIAVKNGSALREAMDQALFDIMDSGTLRRLYEKYWRTGTKCEDPFLNILPGIYSNSMTLKEVAGIFYIMIVCLLASIAIAVTEYIIRSKRLLVDK